MIQSSGNVASDFFEKLRRIPFSVWVLFISLASGGIGYAIFNNYEQRETPKAQMSRLVEGLNRYYRSEQAFPPSLEAVLEMNGWKEWKKIGTNVYMSRQYHYFYHLIDPQRVVIWGIPVGRYREKGETYLTMGVRGTYEIWKGPVLDRVESERVSEIRVPTYRHLTLYNLQKIYSNRERESGTETATRQQK